MTKMKTEVQIDIQDIDHLGIISARAKLFTHSSACVALVEHGFQVCLMSNLFCMTT
jgi:hypothetical protein